MRGSDMGVRSGIECVLKMVGNVYKLSFWQWSTVFAITLCKKLLQPENLITLTATAFIELLRRCHREIADAQNPGVNGAEPSSATRQERAWIHANTSLIKRHRYSGRMSEVIICYSIGRSPTIWWSLRDRLLVDL